MSSAVFPRREKSNKNFFLLGTDYLKWVEGKKYNKDPTAEQVVSLIRKRIINRFGVPAYIVTDNGKNFIGRKVRDLEKEFGLEFIRPSTGVKQRPSREIQQNNCGRYQEKGLLRQNMVHRF